MAQKTLILIDYDDLVWNLNLTNNALLWKFSLEWNGETWIMKQSWSFSIFCD